MTCVADGSPYPDITWWNNNRIVSPNSRVSVSNSGQHLRIQDIELYDAGDYTCLAENSVARRTITASITVISDGNVLPQGFSRFSRVPDQQHQGDTILESHSMTATRGSTIQLACHHSDLLTDNIVWEKNGDEMSAGGRLRVGGDGSLVIYDVEESDAGQYDCVSTGDLRHRRMVRTVFQVISDTQPETSSDIISDLISDTSSSPPQTGGYWKQERLELEPRYDTDLSYDVSGDFAGDRHVAAALEEARRTVDKALNHTVQLLFENQKHSNRTPAELLNIFRYPSGTVEISFHHLLTTFPSVSM